MVICIKNLRVSAILGVYEEERGRPREIIINARIEYNAGKAVNSDALEDALDYKHLRDQIVEVVQGTAYKLIEALADLIVRELAKDPRILKLQIEVDKPNALRMAESVSVILEWAR